MNSDLTTLQKEILEAAKDQLKNESWYRGICIDNIANDYEIIANRKACIDALIFDTYYWDAPNMGFGE